MMHLIFLVPDLHFGGGGERVTTLLSGLFAREGHEVTIISLAVFRQEQIFRPDPGIRITYLNIDLQKGWGLIGKVRSWFALRSYLQEIKAPAMLLGMGNFATVLAALQPRNRMIRTIGCQHGSYAAVKNGWKLLRWLTFPRLDVIVSLTNRDVPKLKRHNPNIRVIPNPVSFYPEQTAALNEKIMLSVGRLDYHKGFDSMVKLFETFSKNNKEWKLRIIGEGPLRSALQKEICNKGLSERILLLPVTDQIQQSYLEASLFLLTSRTEGLPMVLLEAQACGLPIIAFDCETGPAEIINTGLDGYLIAPDDPDEMVVRLTELCNDPAKRKLFGQHARENASRFLPHTILKQWSALFAELGNGLVAKKRVNN